MHPEALALLEGAGQRVEGEAVFFDPDWVLEQVAHAPSEFHLRARDPQHDLTFGGRNMVFSSVSGPPFFRVGNERREGRLADHELMARLVHSFEELDLVTMPVIEPDDAPLDSRHLDMLLTATRAIPSRSSGPRCPRPTPRTASSSPGCCIRSESSSCPGTPGTRDRPRR